MRSIPGTYNLFNLLLKNTRVGTKDANAIHIFVYGASLLVNPILDGGVIGQDFFRLEPQGDFLLGGFNGVGAVADVTADVLIVSTSEYRQNRVGQAMKRGRREMERGQGDGVGTIA